MVWLFVPGLEGSNSDSTSPSVMHTRPSAGLRTRGMPQPLSWPEWQKRPWFPLLSGLTCSHSTASHGVELWISSLRDSRASHGATPASAKAPTTSGGYGPTSLTSFATLSRDASFWRTFPDLLGEGWNTYCGTWPKWGSMRSGTCFRRRKRELRTSANGSSSWPTANVAGGGNTAELTRNGNHYLRPSGKKAHLGLDQAAKMAMYPTPTRADGERTSNEYMRGNLTLRGAAMYPTPDAGVTTRSNRSASSGAADRPALAKLARMMGQSESPRATPTVQDANNRAGPSQFHRNSKPLNVQIVEHSPSGLQDVTTEAGGTVRLTSDWELNPRFVEWLMGMPMGWTDYAQPVTGLSQWLRLWRSFTFELAMNDERQAA